MLNSAEFKSIFANVTEVDTRNNGWQTRLTTYMREKGMRYLGAGRYAAVFEDSVNTVMKVFMKDAAYSRWLAFCFANQHNPYVPKLLNKVVEIDATFDFLEMERLKPYNASATSSEEFMQAYRAWHETGEFVLEDENINAVLRHFEENEILLDLHGENIMMRGDQLVVIDPYYNWFNTTTMKFTIDPKSVDQSIY